MAYGGRRQVEVGSRGDLSGRKIREHHVGRCYSLGRVDRSWSNKTAVRRFSEGGGQSAYEGYEVPSGQNLPHSGVNADKAALGSR